jgi:hypothetical protein
MQKITSLRNRSRRTILIYVFPRLITRKHVPSRKENELIRFSLSFDFLLYMCGKQIVMIEQFNQDERVQQN